MTKSKQKSRIIYVVSDGTGRTCQQVLQAALVQYEDEPVRLAIKPGVRSGSQAEAIVSEAAAEDALIFFTLVADEPREAIIAAAKRQFVPFVDVLGQTLTAFRNLFASSSRGEPGLLYKVEKPFFDRMDAIDYTLRHDDGLRLGELDQAHVVLVGVSRASKSVTCFYLAYRGIRAANVPLLADRPPPDELLALNPQRVIGLTLNVHRLQTLRAHRVQMLGLPGLPDYDDRRVVARELRNSQAQMALHGWRSIDVSFKAVEEVATEIVNMLGLDGTA